MAWNFLDQEDCNTIIVDWAESAFQKQYGQAAADCRVVGAQIAQLVDWFKSQVQVDPVNVHIIGHSLGAHIAGYAGERLPTLGRITGMDPAGPYFQEMQPAVRLDETDATFVDAVSFIFP